MLAMRLGFRMLPRLVQPLDYYSFSIWAPTVLLGLIQSMSGVTAELWGQG